MSDREKFVSRLAEAARTMQAEAGSQRTLDEAVAAITDIVSSCDLVGVSVVSRAGISTPAGNSDDFKRLDQLQYELQEGPCFDALQEHETVNSGDLATDPRWPRWGPHVADQLGIRSVLSYRLYITETSLGALNLYSYGTNAFDHDDHYDGLAVAAHVAVALAGAQQVENLQRAITNRTVIGQAEGILMERFGLSADRAFEVLRRVSQETNTKLHAVAEELVLTRRTPGD